LNNRKKQLMTIYKVNRSKILPAQGKKRVLYFNLMDKADNALVDAYCADYTRERKIGITPKGLVCMMKLHT